MNESKKYSVYVGRWQPFHIGHKWIIDQALDAGKNVAVGIRDTPISGSDPYTVEQREGMFEAVYKEEIAEGKVRLFTIPDLAEICIGRKVGYAITELEAPPSIAEISGTKVRAGEQVAVPPEVASYLRSMTIPTFWLVGLPCSGKTTIARRFIDVFDSKMAVHLDGDELRKGLCSDLGFSPEDRRENIRRVAHLAKHHNNAGRMVVASFVCPTEDLREMAREIIGPGFFLIHVDTPLEVCEKRDVKGMYAKARAGEIKGFTGIDAPFEIPRNPDMTISTEGETEADSAGRLREELLRWGS